MWVVKLGGSLANGPCLGAWLDCIAVAGAGKVVLVPGGGVFADTVRDVQRHWRFSEQTAHLMALCAMEQYGLMLCDRGLPFAPCAALTTLREILAAGRVPVWMPSAMAGGATDIPAGWEVTADSLAAWLSRRIGAGRLLLVKSIAPETNRLELLQQQGMIDPAFADFCRHLDCDVYVCGADAAPAFKSALAGTGPVGVRIAAASRARKRPGVVLESTP